MNIAAHKKKTKFFQQLMEDPKLRDIGRLIFFITLACWSSGSVYYTLMNENHWPLYSMDVFNETPKNKFGHWYFRITADNKVMDIDPANILPLEFFAARGFVGEVVKKRQDKKVEQLFDYVWSERSSQYKKFDEKWQKIYISSDENMKIQLILKISMLTINTKYQITPLNEVVVGEKIYGHRP